jgi:hypothetical protein
MYSAPKNPSSFQSQNQVTDANVVATAASLLSISATNLNAALRYLQIFDKAGAPNSGDTWKYCFLLEGGSATQPGGVVLDSSFFTALGIKFFNGISWAISGSYANFDGTATNTDHIVNGHYWAGQP